MAKIYKSTSVILYELNPDTDGNAGDYFCKINSDTIALTNRELIKANLILDKYCIDKADNLFEDEHSNYSVKLRDIFFARTAETMERVDLHQFV